MTRGHWYKYSISLTVLMLSLVNSRAAGPDVLPDPDDHRIAQVIREFSRLDQLAQEALQRYAYHQVYYLEQLDRGNNVTGTFQREWDVFYRDNGEKMTQDGPYSSIDTLKRFCVFSSYPPWLSKQVIADEFFGPDQLGKYNVSYSGHFRSGEQGAFTFSLSPKEIKPKNVYFDGVVWVDDSDYHIVKFEGIAVPDFTWGWPWRRIQIRFAHFTTYRERVGGCWFPSLTKANDVLTFTSAGPIHIKVMLKNFGFREFRSTTRIVQAAEINTTTR